MKTKIKVPKGWRFLKNGIKLNAEDMAISEGKPASCYSKLNNYCPTFFSGEIIGGNYQTIHTVYIRRIKKGKK